MSKQQRSGSAKHTKTTLSIEQKLKVLDYAKENPKESCRTLSCCYFKNETELRAAYATYRGNNPGNNKRARQDRYQEINKALYKWYSLARESISKRSIEGESANYIDANDMAGWYGSILPRAHWLKQWRMAFSASEWGFEY